MPKWDAKSDRAPLTPVPTGAATPINAETPRQEKDNDADVVSLDSEDSRDMIDITGDCEDSLESMLEQILEAESGGMSQLAPMPSKPAGMEGAIDLARQAPVLDPKSQWKNTLKGQRAAQAEQAKMDKAKQKATHKLCKKRLCKMKLRASKKHEEVSVDLEDPASAAGGSSQQDDKCSDVQTEHPDLFAMLPAEAHPDPGQKTGRHSYSKKLHVFTICVRVRSLTCNTFCQCQQ